VRTHSVLCIGQPCEPNLPAPPTGIVYNLSGACITPGRTVSSASALMSRRRCLCSVLGPCGSRPFVAPSSISRFLQVTLTPIERPVPFPVVYFLSSTRFFAYSLADESPFSPSNLLFDTAQYVRGPVDFRNSSIFCIRNTNFCIASTVMFTRVRLGGVPLNNGFVVIGRFAFRIISFAFLNCL